MISICLGALLLAAATVGFAVRFAPIPGHRTLYLVIASPLLMVAAPVAIVVLSSGRRWVLAALASCLTLAVIVVQLPWYVGSEPDPASVQVRVMTLNMRFGNADPLAVAHVAEANADVVMVQEFTPAAAKGLADAAMGRTFPYHVLDALPGTEGLGVYSRYPITDLTHIQDHQVALVSARVRLDRVAHDTTLVSLHLPAPWPQPIEGWRNDIAQFPSALDELAAQASAGSILIGGDFNSTIDMQPFRQLLTNGYRDAAEQAGSGNNLTYPSNRRFPPLIGIDHVLTRNATAVSTSTVEVPGTDHRALLASVMVPEL